MSLSRGTFLLYLRVKYYLRWKQRIKSIKKLNWVLTKFLNQLEIKYSKLQVLKLKIIIRGENKMPEGIVKKGKTKKDPKLHPEIKQFMEEQRKFNKVKMKNEKNKLNLINKCKKLIK